MFLFSCCKGRKSSGKSRLCSFSDKDECEYPPVRIVHSSNPNTNSKSRRSPVNVSKYDDQGWRGGLEMHQFQRQHLDFGDRGNQPTYIVEMVNERRTSSKKKHENHFTDKTIGSRTYDRTQHAAETCSKPTQERMNTYLGGRSNREQGIEGTKEVSPLPYAVIRPSRTPCSSLNPSTIDSPRIRRKDAIDKMNSETRIMSHQDISDPHVDLRKGDNESLMDDTARSSTRNRICDQDTERANVQESSDICHAEHLIRTMFGKDISSTQVDTRASKTSFSSSYEQNSTHMIESINFMPIQDQCNEISSSQNSSSRNSSPYDNERKDMQDVDWEAKRNEIASNIKRSLSQNSTPIPDQKPQTTTSVWKQSQRELLTADTDLLKSKNLTIEADLAYFRKKLRNDVTPMHDKHGHYSHTTPKKRSPARTGENSTTSPGTLYNGMTDVNTPASVSASTSYSNTPGNQTPESSSLPSNARGTIWNEFYDDCIRKPYETDLNLHTKRSMPNYKTTDLGVTSSVEGKQFNLTSAMSSESSLATEPLWNTFASVFNHNHSRSELDVALSRIGSRQVSLANLRNTSNYRLGSTAGLSLEPSRVGNLDAIDLTQTRQAKVHDSGLFELRSNPDALEENKVEAG